MDVRRHDAPDEAPRSTAYWTFFLPSGDDVSLIEVGAGSGAISELLAGRVGRLLAVSFSSRSHDAVTARATEGVEAKQVAPGEALPARDASLDGVVLDRTLNHPSIYATGADPHGSAARLLRETHRVLKPSGVIYVGVENARFHGFGLRAVVDRLRKSTPLRDRNFETNLEQVDGPAAPPFRLSLAGYRELLSSAGFRSIRVFAPLPDAVHPQTVMPLDCPEALAFVFERRIRRNSAKARVTASIGGVGLKTGLLPSLLPYYYLVAVR